MNDLDISLKIQIQILLGLGCELKVCTYKAHRRWQQHLKIAKYDKIYIIMYHFLISVPPRYPRQMTLTCTSLVYPELGTLLSFSLLFQEHTGVHMSETDIFNEIT